MKSSPKEKRLPRRTVLHILTGSIAAYKAADLVGEMRDQGARVVCVLTEAARHFVSPLVLRAVSGERVYHDFFSPETPYDVLHTSLAQEADVILVAPASADFVARLALGLADDLASCIVLAARRPVVVVPAMNDQMYTHPLTQEHLGKIRSIGYHVIEPVKGHLVCGREAIGHVAENSAIVAALKKILNKGS